MPVSQKQAKELFYSFVCLKVRRQAQSYLFTMLSRFFFSYQIIINRIIELLNRSNEVDHDQIKGCLYIILGNDSFFLPTKHSWIVLEKLWPALVCTKHATKITTQNLVHCIVEKIYKRFNNVAIVEYTDDISKQAAANLWRPLEEHELELNHRLHKKTIETNICSYKNLMEKLSSLLGTNFL